MNKLSFVIACTVLPMQMEMAHAVSGDNCVAFLRAVGQDVSTSESHVLQQASFYNAYCRDNRLNERTFDETSVGLAYEGLGVDFGTSSGTVKEKAEHFCQTFDTKNLNVINQSVERRQFSEAAFRSFDACIRAAQFGATIGYVEHAQGGVTVSFGAGANPLKMSGFFKSDNIDCRSDHPDTKLDNSFSLTIGAGESFRVDCNRSVVPVGNDSGYGPAFVNIGFGNGELLPINLAGERLVTPISASELEDKLDRSLKALSADISALDVSVIHECRFCMMAWGAKGRNDQDVCGMGDEYKPTVPDSKCTAWITRGRSGTPRAEIRQNPDIATCNLQWELECR
jgi:hypothetical protein